MFNFTNFKHNTVTSLLLILLLGAASPQPVISTSDKGQEAKEEGTLEAVSAELVLSVDASNSIDFREFELQQKGYIAAFKDAEVQQAIKNLPEGLAVTMQFWSNENVVDIDWYQLIEDGNGGISNLQNFIDKIDSVHRTGHKGMNGEKIARNKQRRVTIDGQTTYMGGGTDITLAIKEAHKLLVNNNYDGKALIIDVSGDGISDDSPYAGPGNNKGFCPMTLDNCPPLEAARDAAVAAGITINGLPIVNNQNKAQLTHKIDKHYQKLVVGGEGAFVEVAKDFNDFTRAAKSKILREIKEAKDPSNNSNNSSSPVANDDTTTTSENESVSIDVLYNDTDPAGNAFSIDSVDYPSNGTATIENGQVVYYPNYGFDGPDSFTYKIVNSEGKTDSATVNVIVSPLVYAD